MQLDIDVNAVNELHGKDGRYSTKFTQAWNHAVEWYSSCLKSHENCRVHRSKMEGCYPTRLLDVSGPEALIKLAISSQESLTGGYATLSHCWGAARNLKLTESNLDQLLIGIPLDSLSRTFKEAIQVARRL